MIIDSKQWRQKPKRIGKTADGDEIVEIVTKGGLNVVSAQRKGGKLEILGCGPHRALARYMAQQKLGSGAQMEFAKSEEHVIRNMSAANWTEYEGLRDRLNGL